MKVRAQILLKNGLIASAVGVAAMLSAGTASAQQYTGAGSTLQPRQPTWEEQQRRQEAERQRRNAERLEEIRRNNQARQQQQGMIESYKQQYRYRSPYGPY